MTACPRRSDSALPLVKPAHNLCALALLATPSFAFGDPDAPDNIQNLSLEELMNIEVTVASRSEKPISRSPSAVYVISGDEIRRAGHSSVQEALRMAPGFLVGHWQTNTWDVTARGFTSRFNNNLLVLVDGVNVYDLFSAEGVRWHLQSLDVEEIDRIEVIRGPGATLWGQNAVNGVVNIVTKSAAETQGSKVRALAGDEERQFHARHGAAWGEKSFVRAWVLGLDRDPLLGYAPGSADTSFEDTQLYKAGFRGDFALEDGASLTVLSQAYAGRMGEGYTVGFPTAPFYQSLTDDTPQNGGSIALAWSRPREDGGADRVVTSYQRHNLKQVDFRSGQDIVDLDWQRRLPLSESNTLTFGLGYRMVASDLDGEFIYGFRPERSTIGSLRVFAIDELRFPSLDLECLVGAEAEYNDITGAEFQPSLRAIWSPTQRNSVWASISRAVRIPSLLEIYRYNQYVDTNNPTDIILEVGNEDLDPEELTAFELGWRTQVSEQVALDVVGFYNDLDSLVTRELATPFAQGPNTFFPETFGNFGAAEAWGYELAVDAVITDGWRLRGAHTHYEQNSSVDAASDDLGFPSGAGLTPENISNLRSYLDLGGHWELDVGLYYVDEMGSVGTPSYFRTDVRLGYSPSADWRFTIGVQNANDPDHPENGGYRVERNVWFSLSWQR